MPGTLILDCEGLSKLYRDDKDVARLVAAAQQQGRRVATTAMTLLEADYERIHPGRVRWVLSQIDVRAVTRKVADAWHDRGIEVERSEVGEVIQLLGRGGGDEVLVFRASERAMTLQGESECSPN